MNNKEEKGWEKKKTKPENINCMLEMRKTRCQQTKAHMLTLGWCVLFSLHWVPATLIFFSVTLSGSVNTTAAEMNTCDADHMTKLFKIFSKWTFEEKN